MLNDDYEFWPKSGQLIMLMDRVNGTLLIQYYVNCRTHLDGRMLFFRNYLFRQQIREHAGVDVQLMDESISIQIQNIPQFFTHVLFFRSTAVDLLQSVP